MVTYAVVRETNYTPDKPIYQSQQFQQFQQEHARLRGYQGTIVVDPGSGRFITLILRTREAAVEYLELRRDTARRRRTSWLPLKGMPISY